MADQSLAAASAAPVDAGRRGSLEIADRAVEHIARAAILEVPGVATGAETSGGALGAVGSALGRDLPRLDCATAGRRVRVTAEIATVWPHPAAQVALAVRDHVTERLLALADLDVDGIEITVGKVVRSTASLRRRVQ